MVELDGLGEEARVPLELRRVSAAVEGVECLAIELSDRLRERIGLWRFGSMRGGTGKRSRQSESDHE